MESPQEFSLSELEEMLLSLMVSDEREQMLQKCLKRGTVSQKEYDGWHGALEAWQPFLTEQISINEYENEVGKIDDDIVKKIVEKNPAAEFWRYVDTQTGTSVAEGIALISSGRAVGRWTLRSFHGL